MYRVLAAIEPMVQLGRRAQQTQRRRKLAEVISQKLLATLDLDRVEDTGSLYPRLCDLRKRSNKTCFGFLKPFKGRVFTPRLCLLVTKKIINSLPFQLTRGPRETLESYQKKQAVRLAQLAKKSKRMDTAETQLMDFEAGFRLLTFFSGHVSSSPVSIRAVPGVV